MKIQASCYGNYLVVMAEVMDPATGAAQVANPIAAYLYEIGNDTPIGDPVAMVDVDVAPGVYVAMFNMTGRRVENFAVVVNGTVGGNQRSAVHLFGNKYTVGAPTITVTSKPVSDVNKP